MKPRVITKGNKISLYTTDRILTVGILDKKTPDNIDLPLDYKKRLENLEKKFSKTKKESLTSPCKNCLVKTCCKTECKDFFLYLNHLAENIEKYNSDEIFYIRNNTGPKIVELAVVMNKQELIIDVSCYEPQ
jgi:radical SAM protein with 4Fe4S-binding SPASM domain